MAKLYVRFNFLDGLKQEPKDLDFCITPVLKFSRMPKEHNFKILKNGFALGLEWGHWALVTQFFTIKDI